MYLHYFKSSAYIHFKGKQNNWLFAIGEVAQFFRTGGSRSPELWLILARIIQALRNTATHRETTHILSDIDKRIEDLEKSNTLKLRWIKYTKDYRYAEDITYDNVIEALRVLKATLKFGPKIKS